MNSAICRAARGCDHWLPAFRPQRLGRDQPERQPVGFRKRLMCACLGTLTGSSRSRSTHRFNRQEGARSHMKPHRRVLATAPGPTPEGLSGGRPGNNGPPLTVLQAPVPFGEIEPWGALQRWSLSWSLLAVRPAAARISRRRRRTGHGNRRSSRRWVRPGAEATKHAFDPRRSRAVHRCRLRDRRRRRHRPPDAARGAIWPHAAGGRWRRDVTSA